MIPIHIHEGIDHLPNEHPVFYFSRSYLLKQKHDPIISYQSSHFEWLIVPVQESAMSIPGSPFGSVFVKDGADSDEFIFFWDEVKQDLEKRGVNALQVRHPSVIYPDFVPGSWLEKAGFEVQYTDLNQHIILNDSWEQQLHKMQKRKLNALSNGGFVFKKLGTDQLAEVHRFISECREAQGLRINISLELLTRLHATTGTVYEWFGVFKDDTLTSAVIMVQTTRDIIYYYLPATHPHFRSYSPMVLLLAGVMEYYREKGLKIMDLGVSSREGNLQEGLRVFKERMGAVVTKKPTYRMTIECDHA